MDALPFPRWPKNLYVFGVSHGHQALPFVTRPVRPSGLAKRFFINFVGRVDNYTDKFGVRSQTMQSVAQIDGALISTERVSCKEFDRVVESSVFTAAPRGFGPTSFRLYEAMGLGSIPVYIWEGRAQLPLADRYDWRRLAVVMHKSQLPDLASQLAGIDAATRADMVEQGSLFYSRHCTLEGAAQTLIDLLPPVSISGNIKPPLGHDLLRPY